MRSFRFWFVMVLVAIMLSGCASSLKTGTGSIEDINLDRVDEMFEAKSSFVVYFAQTDCGYCHDFNEILDPYVKNHPVQIYRVLLDQEKNATPADNLARIQNHFPDFRITPSVYYVKNGEFVSDLNPNQVIITSQMLEKWIGDNHLEQS